MDHLGALRNKSGEPLLCFILNRPVVHFKVLEELIQIGLPMYEAINPGKNHDLHGIMINQS